MMSKIAVVDDDPQLRRLLSRYLGREGFEVFLAAGGDAFWPLFERETLDLVLLDVVMPGEDGVSIASRLRARSSIGIIMLTERADTADRVIGLEIGADDYIAKPFELRELLARIRSLLRRSDMPARKVETPEMPRALAFEGMTLDLSRRDVIGDGGWSAGLTSAEFELLTLLASNAQDVVSRDVISREVLGRAWDPTDRSVDVLISQIRKKLKLQSHPSAGIKSVRGVGYVLAADVHRQFE